VPVFEQYKLLVEMADRVSQRRHELGRFHVSMHTTVLTLLATAGVWGQRSLALRPWMYLVPLPFVLAACALWREQILAHAMLSSAKFRVIEQLEQQLPVRAFALEWEHLGRGKERRYRTHARLEARLPAVVALAYMMLAGSLVVISAT